MSHYICTGGCQGESPNPGVCQAASCPHFGEPLEECDCEDGRHEDRQESDIDEV